MVAALHCNASLNSPRGHARRYKAQVISVLDHSGAIDIMYHADHVSGLQP